MKTTIMQMEGVIDIKMDIIKIIKKEEGIKEGKHHRHVYSIETPMSDSIPSPFIIMN